ncbi:MAG: MarC family protein [Oleispira sp.]|nr:MarC family protein [Oleispira sp.]
MTPFYSHIISVFLGFFAIMNPIANTAVFVGLTANMNDTQQRRVAIRSLLIAFIVILMFSILGRAIFDLFGITLPALRITGGILVFIIGYQMIHGNGSKMHTGDIVEIEGDQDVAVSPLAVPILAGPGTIATAMNSSAAGGSEVLVTILAFAVLCIFSYLCFISGPRILRLLGQSGLSIITRLMGLILAVIGTQMFLVGLSSAIKEFFL